MIDMLAGFFLQKIINSIKKEDGIAPVVGVMLMLVVTIVIAAVVVVFATGVLNETEEAPVAVLSAVVDVTGSK